MVSNKKFQEELKLHQAWLDGDPDGIQADFSGDTLEKVDFSGCNLQKALFEYTVLSGADLSYAKLQNADMHNALMNRVHVEGTKFNGADLSYVIMAYTQFYHTDICGINGEGINLSGSDLSNKRFTKLRLNKCIMYDTNLSSCIFQNVYMADSDIIRANMYDVQIYDSILDRSDLTDSNLTKAIIRDSSFENCRLHGVSFNRAFIDNCMFDDSSYDENTLGFSPVCPSEGSFIGYVSVGSHIVVLEIPADAVCVSGITLSCRSNKANVLRIEDVDGNESDLQIITGDYEYKIGTQIVEPDFDENKWLPYGRGITFYMSKDLARRCK